MKTFYVLLVLAVLLGCKKKVQPDFAGAQNACDCSSEVSANFSAGQYWKDEFIPLDTIHMYMNYIPGYPDMLNTNCFVDFRADDQNATSYEWQIGFKTTTFSTANVGLYFSDTVGNINVRLIVHSKPRTDCFPNDDGVDTINKTVCIKSLKTPPLSGSYYGYLKSNPSHFFTVVIDTFVSPVNSDNVKYGIKNLPEGNLFDILGNVNTMSFDGINEGFGYPGIYYQFVGHQSSGVLRNMKNLSVRFSAKKYSTDGNWTVVQNFTNEEFIGVKQ